MDTNIIENPEIYTSAKKKVTDTIKGYVFDLVAVALITAMFLLGLGILELKELTWETLLDVLISFVPYYIGMIILNTDYYTKGTFKGKTTEIYKNAMTAYSSMAGSLSGEQQETIYEFCEQYNDLALKQLQTSILKRAAIKYEDFVQSKDDTIAPIAMTKEELKKKFNKEQVKVIMAAKRARIHGISANILLSNIQSIDNTDIGKSEKEMRNSHMTINNIFGFVSVFVLCLIGLKDLQEWNWWSAALVLFRMVWIFARAYMEYFKAYSDITVNLVNHLARKSDILKQFQYWHHKNKTSESKTQVEILDGDDLTLALESNN